MSSSPTPQLKHNILDRIKNEQICPRSRWFFRSVECVVWTAWLVSVLIGAVAVAVTLYVVRLRQYDLFEVTHGNFWYLMAEALPYLWLVTLVGVVVLAVYNLRHTARGYRYPVWVVTASSVFMSVILGGGLHLLNVGFMVDRSFGEHMPTYPSQMKRDERNWQQPQSGRLIGQLFSTAEATSTLKQFIDMHETVWIIETRDLTPADLDLLVSETKVRLMGVIPNVTPAVFHVCGVYPWLMDVPPPVPDMTATRRDYEARMSHYSHERDRHLSQLVSTTTLTKEQIMVNHPCLFLPALPPYNETNS